MNSKIMELNKVFNDIVVKACMEYNDDEILCTLTAGMDTRLILSVLLNNNIKPHCFTYSNWERFGKRKDIKVAGRIAKDFKLVHTVVNKKPDEVDFRKDVNDVLKRYKVVFYGEKMSEIFNKFNRLTESEKKLDHLAEHPDSSKYPNFCFPGVDKRVRDLVYDIPIMFRMFGYLNVCLIRLNCEDLLRYPHTYYNMKYVVMEKVHKSSLKYFFKVEKTPDMCKECTCFKQGTCDVLYWADCEKLYDKINVEREVGESIE